MKFFRYLAVNTTIVATLATAAFCGMQTERVEQVERPLPANSPAAVMQECEKPVEGVYPTGVVLQMYGGGTYLFRKAQMVDDVMTLTVDHKTKPEGVRQVQFCK